MKKLLLTFICAIGLATTAHAKEDEIYTGLLSDLAVSGYDTVAYFTMGKPVEGKAKYSFEWKGATWLFVNADHLAKFKANPTAYAPQFGGYCSWAVAHNYTASGDPEAWRIIDNKLYLNYNKPTQVEWLKDTTKYIAGGNQNWPAVLSE